MTIGMGRGDLILFWAQRFTMLHLAAIAHLRRFQVFSSQGGMLSLRRSLGLSRLFSLFAALLLSSVPVAAEQQRLQYATPDITFATPPGFSPLQSGGSQTVKIVYNRAIANQVRKAEVKFVVVDTQTIGLEGAEWSDYVRFRHFGINGQPRERQTRTFMGQSVVGDIYYRSMPGGGTSYVEFYLVPLTQGRQLAIAFETDTELPLQVFEETIQTISSSLKEVPQKKKRRKF
jgi:hypothetical protein